MVKTADPHPELTLARDFDAPREVVFKAWSSADHIKRWFCPEGMTVAEAKIEFEPGGAFEVCMRAADGQDFWSKGKFTEIVPPERLVMTDALEFDGQTRFTVVTTVTFAAIAAGKRTRMTVHQAYEILDPKFGGAVAGASEGWRTTLDRLEAEIARIMGGE